MLWTEVAVNGHIYFTASWRTFGEAVWERWHANVLLWYTGTKPSA